MSARDDLFDNLMLAWEYRTHEDRSQWVMDSHDLINAFAHELAEQIRKDSNRVEGENSWTHDGRRLMDKEDYLTIEGMNAAADLIDPEMEN